MMWADAERRDQGPFAFGMDNEGCGEVHRSQGRIRGKFHPFAKKLRFHATHLQVPGTETRLAMIYVCSLARLHATVADTHARHIVTLINDQTLVVRPKTVAPDDHLFLTMHDIAEETEGFNAPGEAHVHELIAFVRRWPRKAPLVFHCWAGISRSSAGAYITACALNPKRDEGAIARAIRVASPTAFPNPRLVALADRVLGRDGRMIAGIAAIGRGAVSAEGTPFRVDLE